MLVSSLDHHQLSGKSNDFIHIWFLSASVNLGCCVHYCYLPIGFHFIRYENDERKLLWGWMEKYSSCWGKHHANLIGTRLFLLFLLSRDSIFTLTHIQHFRPILSSFPIWSYKQAKYIRECVRNSSQDSWVVRLMLDPWFALSLQFCKEGRGRR